MAAYGGEVRAVLRLDLGQFNKDIATATSRMKSLSSAGAGAASKSMSESFNKANSSIKEFNQRVGEAKSHSNALGGNIASTGSKISSAFSAGGRAVMKMGNTLANLTNSVVSFNVWMGALVGKVFYDFTIGAAMARDESLSLFKFVGMSANEVNRLSVATDQYAQASSKVAQPEMLSAWKLVRLSHKLTADQMIKNQDILGDTIGLFKSNGRTAEDAGRAIEDAMAGGADGIKRMKEIGITSMKELTDKGFDPKKPETFFNALRKIYDERGILGYGMKVTSLADRFENLKEKIQLIGIAAGETLMPAMEMIVNVFTAVFNAIPKPVAGAIVAITGLTIILGFFWDTLVTIGGFIGTVIAKLLSLAGATVVYEVAADGAATSNVMWGATFRKLGASMKGMYGSMLSLTAAMGFFAAAVAVLVGSAYLIGQTSSATLAWKNATEQHNKQMTSLNKNKTTLNNNLKILNQRRAEAIKKGKSTADIDREISQTKKDLANNTDAATKAQKDWNDAQEVSKGLKELKEQRSSAADISIARSKSDILGTPEATTQSPETNIALKNEADEYNKLNDVKVRYAGTLERIRDGNDSYSKYWRKNQKDFDEYTTQYDEFVVSNNNFQDAIKKQDIGGIIWFGLERAFNQADVGLMEMHASIQSWWADTTAWWQGAWNNTMKWFSDGWNWMVSGLGDAWNDLTSGISKAWDDVVNYFNDPTTIGGGIVDGLRKIYCWIMGCSPGIVPALRIMQGVFEGVFGAVWGFIQPAISAVSNFASTIYNKIIGTVNWIKQAWKDAVKTIQSNPVVARITQTGAWVINWLKQQWVNARRFIQSLPIVGRFMSSGNSPGAKTAASPFRKAVSSMLGGPGGPGFINMASGFRYVGYGGVGQSIATTFATGAGNCVDGTLAQMALAEMYGIPSEMIQTTWRGNPHVYARIAGRDRDIANRALTGSWNAPPRGPGGDGTIVIYGDVYGYNDFVRKVEQANNRLVRR